MAALFIAVGYLAGSIPFGLLLTRAFAGTDVRSQGSGNIGATNVSRVAGKKVGALVLLLDAAKGSLPVLAAMQVLPGAFAVHAGVGYAAFLGHVFPPWLRFKGGKGVATALGVLVVLLPWSALAGFVIWAGLLAATRISSIGSLLGALVAVIAGFFQGRPLEYALLGVVIFLSMLWTHRGNLERIARRNENQA